MPGVSYLWLHLQISQGFKEGVFVNLCLGLPPESGKSPQGPLRITWLMFVAFFVFCGTFKTCKSQKLLPHGL